MKNEKVEEIINLVNEIQVGQVETIVKKLHLIKRELYKIDQPDLARFISEPIRDLERGKTGEFRKNLSKVSSKLGHEKD